MLAAVSNYLVWYAKDIEQVKYRQLFRDKLAGGDGGGQHTWGSGSIGAITNAYGPA